MEIININKYNNLFRNKVSNNLRTQAPYQIDFSPNTLVPYGISGMIGGYSESTVNVTFQSGSQNSVILFPTITNIVYSYGSGEPPAFLIDKQSIELNSGNFNTQQLKISILYPSKNVLFDFKLRLIDKVNNIHWDLDCQAIGDASLHGNCHIDILSNLNGPTISPSRGSNCGLPQSYFCSFYYTGTAISTRSINKCPNLNNWNWHMIVMFKNTNYNSFLILNPGEIVGTGSKTYYEINHKFSIPKYLPYIRDSDNFILGKIIVKATDTLDSENLTGWHGIDIKLDYHPNLSPVIRNVRNLKYDKLFPSS